MAKLFGDEPAQQVEEDLRRFKQLMEAGEIAFSYRSTFLRRLIEPPAVFC